MLKIDVICSIYLHSYSATQTMRVQVVFVFLLSSVVGLAPSNRRTVSNRGSRQLEVLGSTRGEPERKTFRRWLEVQA